MSNAKTHANRRSDPRPPTRTDTGQPEGPRSNRLSFVRTVINRPEFGPFILLVVEIVGFAALNPLFLSPQNLSNVLAFAVELGMIALATALLMIAGEFDLSVGSVFGFSAVLMWMLFNAHLMPLPVAFLVSLAAAGLIGALNGWFVTRMRITSFLVTLGMLLVVRGAALYITHGFPQNTPSSSGEWLAVVLAGHFKIGNFRVYASLFWFIAEAIGAGYVLSQTWAGNWILAVGGNARAALMRGVNVNRTKTVLFILSALSAAFAGALSSIRVSAANPNSGTGYELQVIAMVVIGGTSLMGGRGTVLGTVFGILILQFLRNGLILVGVPGLAYSIFVGAIILGMMALYSRLELRHHAGT